MSPAKTAEPIKTLFGGSPSKILHFLAATDTFGQKLKTWGKILEETCPIMLSSVTILGTSPKIKYFPLELCSKLQTRKFRYSTSTVAEECDIGDIGLLLTAPGDDGGRGVWSTVDDRRRLLVTLSVQLWARRHGRLCVRHGRAGPLALTDSWYSLVSCGRLIS